MQVPAVRSHQKGSHRRTARAKGIWVEHPATQSTLPAQSILIEEGKIVVAERKRGANTEAFCDE